jgi:hypothetical protein
MNTGQKNLPGTDNASLTPLREPSVTGARQAPVVRRHFGLAARMYADTQGDHDEMEQLTQASRLADSGLGPAARRSHDRADRLDGWWHSRYGASGECFLASAPS